MKNTTKQKKLHKGPSEKSRWAYWMQAIEPNDEAINKAFPDYHPQWVQMSQMRAISPAMFTSFRQGLDMTQEQCAAYLRVGLPTITAWERGSRPVPFACFELLRVIRESVSFKMSHPEWDGWFISKDGAWVSPDLHWRECCFTPERLNYIASQGTEASRLRGEVNRLQAELNEAAEENTKLRQMFLSQGVVDELYSMHDRMSSLINQLATAHVVPFPAAEIKQSEQLENKMEWYIIDEPQKKAA